MVDYQYDGNDILDTHSIVKHKLIEEYLFQYFCTYIMRVPRNSMRIAVVDGFSGGGLFRNGYGTPLRALMAARRAEKHLTEKKKRPAHVDAEYFFIDSNPKATTLLQGGIEEYGFQNDKVRIYTGTFAEHLDGVCATIRKNYKTGRCIFVLDPYDWTTVNLNEIRKIHSLGESEIIWLVTTDHVSHYLTDDGDAFFKTFTESVWHESKDVDLLRRDLLAARKEGKWALCRHILCKFLARISGYPEASDFPIKQVGSNKDYTILHLSKHFKGREVMVSAHWEHGNDTQVFHFDGLEYQQPSYHHKMEGGFDFNPDYRNMMISSAVEDLVQILTDEKVPVEDLLSRYSRNFSAMTSLDLIEVFSVARQNLKFFNAEMKETASITQAAYVSRATQMFWDL